MAELKPCPFCGGEAEMVQPHDDMYIVGCSNEDCSMWCGLVFNVKEHAVKFWNTRTPQKLNHNSLCETETYKVGE